MEGRGDSATRGSSRNRSAGDILKEAQTMPDPSKYAPPLLKSPRVNGDPHPTWGRLVDLGGLLTSPEAAVAGLPLLR